MIVVVDLKIWATALAVCSLCCAVGLMIWVRRESTWPQKVGMLIASAIIGPLLPVLGVIVLPTILSNLWHNMDKPSVGPRSGT